MTARRVSVALGLLCAALLAVLAGGYAVSAQGKSTAESDVKAVLLAQEAAWNKGDLDGFMAGYWMDEKTTFYSGGTVTQGWVKVMERYQKRYKDPGQQMGKLEFSDMDFTVVTADAVVARGAWKVTFDGKPASSGLFTLLVRKLPEGWKVVHDHTSSAS